MCPWIPVEDRPVYGSPGFRILVGIVAVSGVSRNLEGALVHVLKRWKVLIEQPFKGLPCASAALVSDHRLCVRRSLKFHRGIPVRVRGGHSRPPSMPEEEGKGYG